MSDDILSVSHEDIGKCQFFRIEPFLDAANILVAADEPMRAIELLKQLPGYYRDNPPKEALDLIAKIHALLATPHFYMNNEPDKLVRVDMAEATVNQTLRGKLIDQDVKAYNDKKVTPHIVDLGPGEYWLPIGLSRLGRHFTYQAIGLCSDAKEEAKKHLIGHLVDAKPAHNPPTIFVACEIIEHLHNESDILVEFMRARAEAEIIHVSTPKYTFDTRQSQIDWEKKGDLGHLRTYTPREFEMVVCKMFPDYNWGYCDSQIMHLRGHKNKV